MRKLLIVALCFITVNASAAMLSVCNMPSSKTVQIRIYDITTTTLTQDWTSTGVTERANGLGKSCYYKSYSWTAGDEYQVDWQDNSSPVKMASEIIASYQTYVDAKTTTRLASTGVPTNFSSMAITAGGAVTAGTVSDKTGYALSVTPPAASDIWGYATRTLTSGGGATAQQVWEYATRSLTDKSGFALTQTFPTNFSSLAITAGGAVTAGTVSDKAGYTVSTVSDKTGYSLSTTPPTAQQISTQIWSEALPGGFGSGTAGFKLNSAASAGDPWGTSIPGAYGAGTAGYILGTNLNGTITSRLSSATYTPPDNASVAAIKAKTDNLPSDPASNTQVATRAAGSDMTTLLGRLTALRAGYMDNLSGGAVALDSTVAKESTLTTKIPTNFTYTAGRPNVNVAAQDDIDFGGQQKASLNAATPSVTANIDPTDIENAILDALIAGHSGAGTVGEKISQAAAAGDPLSQAVPGGYSAGTAGYALGTITGDLSTVQTTVDALPTLAEIEGTSILLKRTGGSVTNELSVTSDNKVITSVSLSAEDMNLIAQAVVSAVGDPKELREGNIRKTFYTATSVNSVRKVAMGRLDRVKIETKADTDVDWTAPTSTKYLYFWYSRLGDTNPSKVGENN